MFEALYRQYLSQTTNKNIFFGNVCEMHVVFTMKDVTH